MKWSRIVIMLIPLGVLLPLTVLADDGKISAADTVTGSRWAKVDLTQYCGRTVGELLDTLGTDYLDCWCGGEPLYGLGCTFEYDDGLIELGPYTYQYVHPNRHDLRSYHPGEENSPWNLDDFRKETINYVLLEIDPSQGVSVPRVGSGDSRHKGFGLDYAGYIGVTIDSLVNDIGYPIMSSRAFTDLGKYHKCLFHYANGIEIYVGLETPIPIPSGVTNINLVTDIVLRQRIDYLRVEMRCSERGEGYRGTLGERMPDDRQCESSVGANNTSKVAGERADSARERNAEYYIQRDVKRHNAMISELIRQTGDYNNAHKSPCVGTLVIYQSLDDTTYYYYDIGIGGKYYETGVNYGHYLSFTRVVAIVQTHTECADPSPEDIYAFAHGALGPVVIIIDANDNCLSVMRYSDVKTARSYASYNSQAAIADKCRDPLDPTPPCDRRLELIRKFFDTENTGIDYIHITDWLVWV